MHYSFSGFRRKGCPTPCPDGSLTGAHFANYQIIRIASFGTTVEVSIDGSQSFAIRKDELTALNCQVVATPLTCSDVQLHMTYRIRTLSGGRKFQQHIEAQGIQLKKRE